MTALPPVSSPVASPYFPPLPAGSVAVPAPGDGPVPSADAVSLTRGLEAATVAPDAGEKVGRLPLFIACAATALSMLAPGPAAAASSQAATHAVTVSAGAVKHTVAKADTRVTKDAVIDRMLRQAPGRPPLPEGQRRMLAGAMARIPLDVLQTLERNGTRISVAAEGQTPLDVGLVGPLDLGQAYANPQVLVQRSRQAMQGVDDLYGSRIAELEARAGGSESNDESMESDGYFAHEEARLERDSLLADRDAMARRAVQEATDGLVEPASLATVGLVTGLGGHMLPTTLNEMARLHGARTPSEVREFVSLVQRLNGDRISLAQADFGDVGPDKSRAAFEDRPFLAQEAGVLVPAYEYYRAEGKPEQAPVVLRTHDAQSVVAWSDGAVLGQYFYQDGRQSVLLGERAFGGEENGPHAVLHELGHAWEDAERRLNPAAYPGFRAERDQAYLRMAETEGHPFRHQHAGASPAEMVAETFAVATEGKDAALRRADPQWTRAFEGLKRAAVPRPQPQP